MVMGVLRKKRRARMLFDLWLQARYPRLFTVHSLAIVVLRYS